MVEADGHDIELTIQGECHLVLSAKDIVNLLYAFQETLLTGE